MTEKKHHKRKEKEEVQEAVAEEEVETVEKSLEEQVRELKQKLEEKEKEAQENYNKFLRALADLDNYKKRVNQEREQLIEFANERLISELLPVLDNFERAIEAAKHGIGDATQWLEGVSLILRQFEDVLGKQGVTAIKAIGEPFDPTRHEAILQEETPEHEDGIVLDEYERGYMLKSRLLRPSKVKVSRNTGEYKE